MFNKTTLHRSTQVEKITDEILYEDSLFPLKLQHNSFNAVAQQV